MSTFRWKPPAGCPKNNYDTPCANCSIDAGPGTCSHGVISGSMVVECGNSLPCSDHDTPVQLCGSIIKGGPNKGKKCTNSAPCEYHSPTTCPIQMEYGNYPYLMETRVDYNGGDDNGGFYTLCIVERHSPSGGSNRGIGDHDRLMAESYHILSEEEEVVSPWMKGSEELGSAGLSLIEDEYGDYSEDTDLPEWYTRVENGMQSVVVGEYLTGEDVPTEPHELHKQLTEDIGAMVVMTTRYLGNSVTHRGNTWRVIKNGKVRTIPIYATGIAFGHVFTTNKVIGTAKVVSDKYIKECPLYKPVRIEKLNKEVRESRTEVPPKLDAIQALIDLL